MKKNAVLLFALPCILLASCSISKRVNRQATADVLNNKAFSAAHIGISIYEPAKGKYWYNYQADKYFVPASNTKLATCYAAMKYLGDSLVGLKFREDDKNVYTIPTGDPTFLHPDFAKHNVFDFLKENHRQIIINTSSWQAKRWGSGWSWDDYSDYYAAERSAMPIYGNILRISNHLSNPEISPQYFRKDVEINKSLDGSLFPGTVHRMLSENVFEVTSATRLPHVTETPFSTGDSILGQLLNDTLNKTVLLKDDNYHDINQPQFEIRSQPTDSMLRPLMHRSDNFFAEQTLLMISEQLLGVMNDKQIIDILLENDFRDLPQKPNWIDGSGLSHYNLFSPLDFIAILNKMKNEFGMDRIKNIFATGGTGTLTNYFKTDSGFIFAKTGTLSGVVALSGFLYTKKNKLLIFSTLVNNHHTGAANIRKGIEKLIATIRAKN